MALRLTDVSDQQDILKAFERALGTVRRDAVRALHANARKAQAVLVALFEREKFASSDHSVRPLGRISARWIAQKVTRGLDKRRGHAGLGLARSIASPQAITKDAKGFTYDIIKGAAGKSTVTAKRGKRRRVPVRSYVRLYERRKAPGLGTFPKKSIDLLQASVSKATATKLSRIRQSARKPGQEFAIDLEIKLGGIAI